MGVRGLMHFCSSKLSHLFKSYNVFDAADNQAGVDLVIDFYAFEFWLLKSVSEMLSKNECTEWVELSGGEYLIAHTLLGAFLDIMEKSGITLVFVMDGPKFSSESQAKFKFAEWVRRDKNEYIRVRKMLDMVSGNLKLGHLNHRDYVRPQLIEVELLGCLRERGIEVICSPHGEVRNSCK